MPPLSLPVVGSPQVQDNPDGQESIAICNHRPGTKITILYYRSAISAVIE